MPAARSTETSFNYGLAAALRDAFPEWRASHVVRAEELGTFVESDAKHADILIFDDKLPPVAVECSYSASDAHGDARGRLGLHTTAGRAKVQTAFAVWIDGRFRQVYSPEEVTTALTEEPPPVLRYALHQLLEEDGAQRLRVWPSRGFATGTVRDLAQFISSAVLPREYVELVADRVARYVDSAAYGLELKLSDSQQVQIATMVNQRTPLKGLRTTMVLWLNALLTQQRLSMQSVGAAKPLDFNSVTLVPSSVARSWRDLREENWRSIFEPALLVLDKATSLNPAATAESLRSLVHAAEMIEVSRLGLHINVGAELFPKLSDDRKEAAKFYTQPATAELLAALTVRDDALESSEWASTDLFRGRRLADLACGTGTLLRAGYRRIRALHLAAGGPGRLHTAAMEEGLVGTDVCPIATHLTASSLAAVGSGAAYGTTQIGWVDVGGRNGKAGSLEYLLSAEVSDLFTTYGGLSTGDVEADRSTVDVGDGTLDWILMNPPYSRTRGGQSAFDINGLSDRERKACQKRWQKLIKHEPVEKRAGMGASFLALARRKIKPGCYIGFVLPLTAAFADVWRGARKMVEEEFEDIVAVAVTAGRALGRDALSADTHMEEMLLVARKRLNPDDKKASRIHCATLFRPPKRLGEASEIAKAILTSVAEATDANVVRPIRVGEDELGSVCAFEPRQTGNPWAPVGVVRHDLLRSAAALADGQLLDCVTGEQFDLAVSRSTIDELFDVGPTHHLIGHVVGNTPIGAFEFHQIRDRRDVVGRDRSLWNADAASQRSLLVVPTHKGTVVPDVGSAEARSDMREYSGDLFYSRNMRWTSQALVAASTIDPVMGGRSWTTLGHRDKAVRRAFALWANSTLGMMVHWTQGQRTHAGRSTTQIGALKRIPVPRLDELKAENLAGAASAFERIATSRLRPGCQAHVDEVRAEIDEAVVEMMGLPEQAQETVERLRHLWCQEPSVHGQNQQALHLLVSRTAPPACTASLYDD